MKTIRFSLISLMALMFALTVSAQEYKITLQNSKENKLVLKRFSGDLPIVGYEGNEIVIQTSAEDLTPPARAKGLKPIYPGGEDNTGIGLLVEKGDNQVTVTCLLPFSKEGKYKIKVPENLALEMESACQNNNNISITNMKNEIDIQNCAGIKLDHVTGPLVLSTISGDIDIVCEEISENTPFSINSVSGDIDITLPENAAINLEMKTVTGAFYSDFDLSQEKKGLKTVGGNQMKFMLNGGGTTFSIETVSSNIYLRKGK